LRRERAAVAVGLTGDRPETPARGTCSDPRHVILYTSNGEARQEFSIVLTARAISDEPTPSDKAREVHWVHRHEVARYTINRSMRLRIGHYLCDTTRPYIGQASSRPGTWPSGMS
jgi:hypothetical protein